MLKRYDNEAINYNFRGVMVNNNVKHNLGVKRLFVFLVVSWVSCIVLSGCSANTWLYDSTGQIVYHIKTDGKATHKLKTNDVELFVDSKQEPLFNFDLNANKVGK